MVALLSGARELPTKLMSLQRCHRYFLLELYYIILNNTILHHSRPSVKEKKQKQKKQLYECHFGLRST